MKRQKKNKPYFDERVSSLTGVISPTMEVFDHFSRNKDSRAETERQSAQFGDGSLDISIGKKLTNSPEEELKRPPMFPAQKCDDKETLEKENLIEKGNKVAEA